MNLDPTKNPHEQNFITKLVDAVPNFALGAIGIFLTMAIVLKIVGIDFSGPINDLTSAYVSVIEMEAQEVKKGEEFRQQVLAIITEQREFMISQMSDVRTMIETDAEIISSIEDSINILKEEIIGIKIRVLEVEKNSHIER